QWRSDTEYNVLTDASYVIELNENKVLMKEEELNARLTEIGVSTENLMYSGWFSKLNADATEGEGFIQDRQYTSSKSYKHSIKDANATFYCYLIEEYDFASSGSGVEISINDVIKMTPAYNSYFTETRKELILPSENNGKSVVTVGDFAQMVGIEEVTIPSETAVIKESAFSECLGLSTVNYNQKLTVIGKKAFFGCVKLTSDATTNIPELVTGIGESAFDGCVSIEEIVLSNRISAVHDKAFANQPKLRQVTINGQYLTFESTIGNGIFSLSGAETEGGFDVTIGENASYVHANFFRSEANADYGKYLGDVVIEDGTKSIEIGANAFRNSGLRSITLNGRMTKVTEYAFFGCKNLESVDLSSTLITEIEHSLFRQSGIKEVIMPASITSIGAFAFAGCDQMESLYYTAKTDGTYGITTINMGAFQYESNGAKNTIRRFVDVSARENVLGNPELHKQIDIPEGTTKILDNAFHSCVKIEMLVIPSTITTIGADAFHSSSALKNIIYNAIETADLVSGMPFGGAGAEGLTLTIGEAVTNIPARAFNGMCALSNLTLPEGLQTIGTNAFANITDLKEINYKAVNLEDVEESVFAGSGSVSGITVNIHASVEELPALLLCNVRAIKQINVLTEEDGSLVIRENALNGVDELPELVLPKMAELTLKSKAFNAATIKRVVVNEKIGKITVESGALSDDVNSYAYMTLVYAGTEIAGETAFLTSGTLVSILKESGLGYDTVISDGNLGIRDDLVVGDDNSLELSTNTTLTISKGELRVSGELMVSDDSVINKIVGQGVLVAVPRNEANLIEKSDGTIDYDTLEFDRVLTIDGAIGLAFDSVRFTNTATITLNGRMEIIAENRIDINGKIIANGELSIIGENEKGGNGVIEISNSSQAILKIDDSPNTEIKTYIDNANKSALSISEGVVSIYPIQKEFIIESGATVTTDSEFAWDNEETLEVKGTLINNASA
ncbi:MAG: leucine-rich repeat protein, partial [Clostridia bacterium]|nr:leucine-rich repeat protein [Clostridia bacterium]